MIEKPTQAEQEANAAWQQAREELRRSAAEARAAGAVLKAAIDRETAAHRRWREARES